MPVSRDHLPLQTHTYYTPDREPLPPSLLTALGRNAFKKKKKKRKKKNWNGARPKLNNIPKGKKKILFSNYKPECFNPQRFGQLSLRKPNTSARHTLFSLTRRTSVYAGDHRFGQIVQCGLPDTGTCQSQLARGSGSLVTRRDF